jgi:hypothetical protein
MMSVRLNLELYLSFAVTRRQIVAATRSAILQIRFARNALMSSDRATNS